VVEQVQRNSAGSADPPRIKIYGRLGSADAYTLRDFLQRSDVPFEWIQLESDEDARVRCGVQGLNDSRLPVCVFSDGTRLDCPTVRQVVAHLGWLRTPSYSEYDVAIYGAGPAGLSAAVYGSSDGLKTVLVERWAVGGQASSTSNIENYLGFPAGISGAELARASICATGVQYRRLELPNAARFIGAGIYYGAGASEAPLCSDEPVYIVGGGNSAGQAAVHFAPFASKVTLIIRDDSLSKTLSRYLVDRILASPNIEVLPQTEVSAVEGDRILEEVTLTHRVTGEQRKVRTHWLFVCIGGEPHTEWAAEVGAVRDDGGYLVTGPDLPRNGARPPNWPLDREPYYLETNLPGVFAAGDVRHGSVKRYASAVGEGAIAIALVHRHLANC
jgi:thioredoxin reductase (NADPH)